MKSNRLSPAFAAIYADTGRPSILPERLLRALLLQAFYYGPLGTAADGAAPLTTACSAGSSVWHRRSGLGPHDCVLQEP